MRIIPRVAAAQVAMIALCWLAACGPARNVESQAKPAAGASPYKFDASYPTKAASELARDDADYQRALTAYRFWYPTVSIEGFFNGFRELGIQDNQALALASAGPQFMCFTPNSDTPYSAGAIDVKDGPMVIELPAGPFIAAADDHHQGWIMDMGLTGPDAGKGGKHLLLPPGYQGKVPNGFQVGRSSSYKVFFGVRRLPLDGDMTKALEAIKTVKIYPLADPSKVLRYVEITGKRANVNVLRWEANLQYWEKLHEVIDAEPVQEDFRPMYGLLADLGIVKGSHSLQTRA
jgi:hypothetical protein